MFVKSKFKCGSNIVQSPSLGNNQTQMDIPRRTSSKGKVGEKQMEVRRTKRMGKKQNFGPDFVSSQAIALLIGTRDGVLNKIPFVLNIEMIQKHLKMR